MANEIPNPTRRRYLTQVGVAAAAAVTTRASAMMAPLTSLAQNAVSVRKPMNVLFMIADDMRPTNSVYGGPIKTPNLERLAARGTAFSHVYCPHAICSPARTSLLTGLRPDTTHVFDLKTHFRQFVPDVVTLPQQFKDNGYTTQRMSKVFHDGVDDAPSWSLPPWQPHASDYRNQARVAQVKKDATVRRGGSSRGPSWEAFNAPDDDYIDGKTTLHAIEELRLRKADNKPFFMAVGFYKPHLPFVAPQRYFDLYPREAVALAHNSAWPKDAPKIAATNAEELRSYSDITMDPAAPPVTDEQARDLRRAYYAAASFTDAQVGRVLDELDRLELRENTIVVFCADHGYHLGENGLWGKATNFEMATHVPLIISVPGRGHSGTKINAIVESVDIYPTLCAAAGLPVPAGKAGVDLMPLIDGKVSMTNNAAFSQFQRPDTMGYSIRTDRWRYTDWKHSAIELYDELNDPGETVNIAGHPASQPIIAHLANHLHASLPKSGLRKYPKA